MRLLQYWQRNLLNCTTILSKGGNFLMQYNKPPQPNNFETM